MSEHFVKYINIKKYKCFSDFSAEGFGRVNLISGKNNVGKTALMEAILLSFKSENPVYIFAKLAKLYFDRNQLEFIGKEYDEDNLKKNVLNQNDIEIETNRNIISFKRKTNLFSTIYTVNNGENEIDVDGQEVKLHSLFSENIDKGVGGMFIPAQGVINKLLIMSFTSIQKKDRELEVFEYLQSLDSSIENVKIIGGDSIQCKVVEADGDSSYRDINEFGIGLRQFLTVIIAMFRAENKSVFIDELGSGIHYTSLDKLWEIILTLSKELNVQVFATTHSRECIESYCRVAEKLKEQDISFITLVRNKERAVKAIVRDYEMFTSSIHSDHEVRGW